MKPNTVLWIGRVTAAIVAILLAYYVGNAFNPSDLIRPLIVALAIVFSCFQVIPYLFVRAGWELHKYRHGCNKLPTVHNLERL